MPSTHDAARFLVETGAAERFHLGSEVGLVGVAPDRDAGPGQAAWISPRALSPERLAGFGGSLLVAPTAADALESFSGSPVLAPPTEPSHPDATLVYADNPRLAFSRLVAEYFAMTEGWPAYEGPVPADARIAADVQMARGVVLGAGVVLARGVRVGPNTCLAHCTLEPGVTVGANCTIGGAGFGFTADEEGRQVPFPHVGRVRIGASASIGDNTCVDRGTLGETVIGEGARIDNHVHIAHNAVIGANALVIAHAVVAGSARVGESAWIAPGAIVRNGITIGARATVGMGAVVTRDVAEGVTVLGNPAHEP
ncbi:MAG: UDP-3-O-(3-hydroxymyristoyl)glucosamine N-acyltransferase [Bacteroidota bacterium]